jgi:cytoskeletal protein RodZ
MNRVDDMADASVGDFGAKMKRAREARGISLRQIATTTKLSVAALEALERNDISRLPGGIFSRAFVRSYAIEVGLDPEQTVRDFIAQFPHDSVTAGSPHVPQEDHAAIESERESAATAVTLIAISVPLVAIILYFTMWSGPRQSPQARPAVVAEQGQTTAATTPAVEPLTFELLATSPVTVEVDIDGVRREAREVATNERLVFEADREMRLNVSDAAAVQLTINGQPAVPLGGPGEQKTVQIGRANYGAFLASQ